MNVSLNNLVNFSLLSVRASGLCILLLYSSVYATDIEREQRWIDQTVDAIFDGEPVFLEADGHRFLSIYTEAETESVNGMIVLHGTGFHPDYEQVVQPIRVEMTQHGWHTLSIQLPLLDSEAEYEDYVSVYPEVPPRIDAAIAYLKQRDISNIVIVAHSQGATMACYYLARNREEISAVVAIGMSAQHLQPHINSAESLKQIRIPVLDLFGSKDFPAVLRTVELRADAGAHNPGYVQQVIEGAYHFFDYREDEMLQAVQQWLEQTIR